MKRYSSAATLIIFFLSISILFSQEPISIFEEIIHNPEKPLNPNAGRILELREEMRISDKGGDFYFSSPTEPVQEFSYRHLNDILLPAHVFGEFA